MSKRATEIEVQREERFRAMYVATRTRISAYALRRTATPEDAADVVAEAYGIAWRRFDDVPQGNESLLWLYATARKVLANHHRRGRRRSELVDRLGRELGGALIAEDETGADRLVARAALGRLDKEDRELLMLASWEGLGSAELSRVLGCTRTAARIRLHRARARLAAEMEALGIETKHSAAPRHSLQQTTTPAQAPERA